MAENKFEMKFRCPMEFVVAPEDVEKDCCCAEKLVVCKEVLL